VDAAELEAGLSDDEEVTAGVLRLLSDTPRNPEGTVQVVQDPRSAHPEVRFNEVLMAGLERHDFENSIWCRIVDHLASQIGIKDWRPIAESNNEAAALAILSKGLGEGPAGEIPTGMQPVHPA
jgi:hypothetical protein